MLGDGDKGTVMGETMKRGYVLSHYAKYATGRTRLQIGQIPNNANARITAYSGSDDITMVLVNTGNTPVASIKIDLPSAVSSGSAVITSETKDMATQELTLSGDKKAVTISLPAKSIVSIKLIK